MTNIWKIVACCMVVTFGQAAQASPEDDIAFIANTMVQDVIAPMMFQGELDVLATQMKSQLAERSVKVIDEDAYIGLMTQHLELRTEPELRAALTEVLVHFAPTALADTALLLRRDPFDLTQGDPTEPLSVKGLRDSLDDGSSGNGVEILGVIVNLIPEINEHNRNVTLKVAYMADVLETDGVFQFPNRIMRKDLIAEIRASNP